MIVLIMTNPSLTITGRSVFSFGFWNLWHFRIIQKNSVVFFLSQKLAGKELTSWHIAGIYSVKSLENRSFLSSTLESWKRLLCRINSTSKMRFRIILQILKAKYFRYLILRFWILTPKWLQNCNLTPNKFFSWKWFLRFTDYFELSLKEIDWIWFSIK